MVITKYQHLEVGQIYEDRSMYYALITGFVDDWGLTLVKAIYVPQRHGVGHRQEGELALPKVFGCNVNYHWDKDWQRYHLITDPERLKVLRLQFL